MKRRALLFTSTDEPRPGDAVVDANGRSWGEILNSAPGTPYLALAVVTLAGLPAELRLGETDGPAMARAPLPYAIPDS